MSFSCVLLAVSRLVLLSSEETRALHTCCEDFGLHCIVMLQTRGPTGCCDVLPSSRQYVSSYEKPFQRAWLMKHRWGDSSMSQFKNLTFTIHGAYQLECR